MIALGLRRHAQNRRMDDCQDMNLSTECDWLKWSWMTVQSPTELIDTRHHQRPFLIEPEICV
jgi:hypothetical protein